MIKNIQFLRFISAYLVVAYHIQPHASHLFPNLVGSDIGAIGVDIFFVISGLIMVFTTSKQDKTPQEFWRDRVNRIVPLYWLATFAMIAVTMIGFAPSGLHDWNGKNLLTSLLFIPDIRKDGVPEPILSTGWTLIYEMFFYFLFGLLLLLRNQLRAVVVLTGIFLVLWVSSRIFQPTSFVVAYYTKPITLEFAAGCVIGLLYIRMGHTITRRPRFLAAMLSALAITIIIWSDIQFHGLIYSSPEFRLLAYGVPAVMIVTASLVLERAGLRCSNRFLLLQGAASYAIYLFHPLLIHSVFKVPAIAHLSSGILVSIVTTFAAFAVVCLGGTLVHLFVEKPLGRLLKGKAHPRDWLLSQEAKHKSVAAVEDIAGVPVSEGNR